MRGNLLRRSIEYALTLFLAVSLNFLLPRLMPGEPLALLAGDAIRGMPADKVAELRAAYGLDKSLGEQYVIYLGNLLRGELGTSYRYSGGRPVLSLVLSGVGWSLLLGGVSLTLATLIGSLLGARAAWRRGTRTDLGLLGGLFVLRAMPSFWLAMIFVAVFSSMLRIFPTGDPRTITARLTGLNAVVDVIYHAILPVTVLTLAYTPTAFAIMRSSMLGVLNADYIRTARAKGVREGRVLYYHAVRNAILPVVTAFALNIGQTLAGITVIEAVFNYRGIGYLMFEAVKSRDYPLMQAGFLVFTVGVVTVNLLTDLIYPRLDPRVKERGA